MASFFGWWSQVWCVEFCEGVGCECSGHLLQSGTTLLGTLAIFCLFIYFVLQSCLRAFVVFYVCGCLLGGVLLSLLIVQAFSRYWWISWYLGISGDLDVCFVPIRRCGMNVNDGWYMCMLMGTSSQLLFWNGCMYECTRLC